MRDFPLALNLYGCRGLESTKTFMGSGDSSVICGKNQSKNRFESEYCLLTILDSLTIVMPTLDRQTFALRGMDYWSSLGVSLIVVDGSATPINSDAVNPFSAYVNYVHLRENWPKRLEHASTLVKTKYVAMVSDDEFYLERGLVDAVTFLDRNPDYCSCSGRAISARVTPFGVTWGPQYPRMKNRDLSAEDSNSRVYQHFSTYVPSHLWSVMREDVWKHAVKLANHREFDLYAQMELQFEFLIPYCGKSRVLPTLMWVRSKGENPTTVNVEPGLSASSRLDRLWNDPGMASQKQDFLATTAKFASHCHPEITNEEAVGVVETCYAILLAETEESRKRQPLFPAKERLRTLEKWWDGSLGRKIYYRLSLLRNRGVRTLSHAVHRLEQEGVDVDRDNLARVEHRIKAHHGA